MASSFLNAAGTIGRVTINERTEAGQRERRVLARVSRAAWRLDQPEPGVLIWHTPAGRTYVTGPTQYPA